AADNYPLACEKLVEVLLDETSHGAEGLIKTFMRLADTFGESHLVGVSIPQPIGGACSTPHSDQDHLIVMTDKRLSVGTKFNIVEKV
ncbi:hypothetical protein, partial [Klebsiella pneumoniae]|uniref:hypothetical protein n=1 Tax=Klebsiella pneumoniae TaxID=573 RepID=UPI00272FE80F